MFLLHAYNFLNDYILRNELCIPFEKKIQEIDGKTRLSINAAEKRNSIQAFDFFFVV